jgi:hypothetical protein
VIHIVTGHICSGKTTFVREHARRGDVIIDMDLLAHAMTTDDIADHDYPDHVGEIARAARWHAIDAAVRLHSSGTFDVWIVHAYPEARDYVTYRRMSATWHEIEAEPGTLRDRAARERPGRFRRVLEARLAAGVGSAAGADSDGRPRVPSTRISGGFRQGG